MKKRIFIFLVILMFSLTLSVIISGISNKINMMSLVKDSALVLVSSQYPEYDFYISKIHPLKNGHQVKYLLTLKIREYKYENVSITCQVSPIMSESGYYYTRIFSATNVHLLKNAKGEYKKEPDFSYLK